MSDFLLVIIVVFLIQLGVIIFLYFTDKYLKLVSKAGIRQVKMYTLKRSRYLFVYQKRKEGIITKYAFVCMILYYMINIAGLITISIKMFIIGDNSSLVLTTLIFGGCDVILLGYAGGPNDPVERGMVKQYMEEEKRRQKRKRELADKKQIVHVACNRPRSVSRRY